MSDERRDQLSIPAVAVGAAVIISLNVALRLSRIYFKRDASGNSFGNVIIGSFSLLSNKDSVLDRDGVKDSIQGYESLFTGAREAVGTTSEKESIKTREKAYQNMVNSFYDLVTDFYEWGWGKSFHFAPRFKGETFTESIKRSEFYLALRSGMGKETKALDVGCGVGGPMRNIHQFTGSDITGVTINDYQVNIGNEYCAQMGMADKCRIVQGDFQKLAEKFDKESFDVAYAIEATCHSPNRHECFSGVYHCLKPGGLFVGYEWVVLPNRGFNPDDPDHVRIKEGIEVGNGLPTLATPEVVAKALEDSGFEILEQYDANATCQSSPYEIPWYRTLEGSFTLNGFRMTHIGRICTHMMVWTLETLRIAPRGSVRVSALLNATALDLVEGGRKQLFTPSYFFIARKKG